MQKFKEADVEAISTNAGQTECLLELQKVARKIAGTPHSRDDGFAQTSAAFLARAANQADSILALRDSFDAWLIARSLVEGYALYNWLSSEPSELESKARTYGAVAFVEGHALSTRLRKYMGTRTTAFSQYVQDGAQAFQGLSTEEAMRIGRGDEPYAIPYLRRVTNKSLKEVFAELDAKFNSGDTHRAIYDLHYSLFSGYHHWSPLLFNIAQEGPFEYFDASPSDYGIALSTFLGAFIGMCFIADGYLKAGLYSKIEEIQERHENLISMNPR